MILRCRKDVEDPAANGELTSILDLIDALVAGRHELRGDLIEIKQVTAAQREGMRSERGIRDLLGKRHGRHHHDGRLERRLRGTSVVGRSQQRVERRNSQPDEVRRRSEVRLVGHAAAGIEAHRSRRQPRAQVRRQLQRLPVVTCDDDRGAPGGECVVDAVEQRRDEVGTQRSGHERAPALACEPRAVRVVLKLSEEGAK